MFLQITAFLCTATVALCSRSDQSSINVLTARCRSHCLNQFADLSIDNNCFDSSECWMCWDTCNMFYKNFRVWGPMCSDEHLCFPGCQESCNFYRAHKPKAEKQSTNLNLYQPLRSSYKPEKDSIHFEWTVPDDYAQNEHLVYILTMQDQLTSSWQQVEQTFYRNATIRRDQLKSSTRLRLVSYDTNGQVAEIEKPCSELDLSSSDGNLMFRDEKHNGMFDNHQDHIDYREYSWMPMINALRYSTKNLGGVDVDITWPMAAARDTEIMYEVRWKNASPEDDVISYLSTDKRTVTISVRPDHVYLVSVAAFANGSRQPIAQSKTLLVDTGASIAGVNPFVNECTRRVPLEYMIMLGGVGTLFVILLVLYILTGKRQRQSRGDIESMKSSSVPEQCWEKGSSKNHSLKKQLSSMSARISQGPLTPGGHHSRLIEEEPSFSFDQTKKHSNGGEDANGTR